MRTAIRFLVVATARALLAMRNCLRLACNGGAVRSGSCVRAATGRRRAASR